MADILIYTGVVGMALFLWRLWKEPGRESLEYFFARRKAERARAAVIRQRLGLK